MEVFIYLLALVWNPVKIRPYFVEGICNIRKENRFFRVKEGKETHRENIVRSHSHKNLIFSNMIKVRQCTDQCIRCRIRIQP